MRIPYDSEAGRAEFEQSMEQRRAQEIGQDWKKLRRGWYLGDETFRKELLAKAESAIGENHLPETRRETAEEKARRIITEELERMGWTEIDLASRPKGDREKIRMARRLRTETTMTLKWIAAQLKTGTGAHTANRLRAANSTTRKEQDEFELV